MSLPKTSHFYVSRVRDLLETIGRMPQAARDEIANGCGPKGALVDLIDDDPLGADFGPPCENHDIGYHLGENKEDKAVADLMFLIEMVLRIIYGNQPKAIRAMQLNIAMKYYAGVHFYGKSAFYAGKKRKRKSNG